MFFVSANKKSSQKAEVVPAKPIEQLDQEKPADPKLVNVSGSSGTVVSVSAESITINTGEGEKKFNLIKAEEGLGVFKKSGEEITIISVADIKKGDQVNLEARQSDGLVNAILVE